MKEIGIFITVIRNYPVIESKFLYGFRKNNNSKKDDTIFRINQNFGAKLEQEKLTCSSIT